MKTYSKYLNYTVHVLTAFKELTLHNGIITSTYYAEVFCDTTYIHLN